MIGETSDDDEPVTYEFQCLTETMKLDGGFAFGELALMSGTGKKPEKRSATVKAETDVHVAILGKDDFTKVLGQAMNKKLDSKAEFFKNFRLADGISRTNLHKLSYYLKEKFYRRRDIVYKEGDSAEQIFFVKEGEFQVLVSLLTLIDHKESDDETRQDSHYQKLTKFVKEN